ncbi:MAG: rod shape-determining protein MreC [Oscillospiraceae bacterium]|jgi:rod shape-determining protein MreC|nr:rod shape-determining protein MreC [Oscillospiraceae bacterium]
MKWIAKHKAAFVVILAVLFVLSMAVASFFTKGRTSPVSGAINTVFRPLHTLIGSVSDYFQNRSDAVAQYEDLLAKYESLRVYVANMEDEKRLADELADENDRLRILLGLNLRDRGFAFETALVTDRNPSAWERLYTLSKGSEAGFEPGQCVLTAEGYLAGMVTEVGNGWATVSQVIDTVFSAGAKVERTGQTAVAEGEWTLMREGHLRLTYLPLGSDIQYGDLVMTSGQGGVVPPGIPLGRVVGVQTEPSGQAEYAALTPEADLDALTQVFIVLDYHDEK